MPRVKGGSEFPGNSLVRMAGLYLHSLLPVVTPSTASGWPPDTGGLHHRSLLGEGLISDHPEVRCSPEAKREVRNLL